MKLRDPNFRPGLVVLQVSVIGTFSMCIWGTFSLFFLLAYFSMCFFIAFSWRWLAGKVFAPVRACCGRLHEFREYKCVLLVYGDFNASALWSSHMYLYGRRHILSYKQAKSCFVSLQVGDRDDSNLYISMKLKAAAEVKKKKKTCATL